MPNSIENIVLLESNIESLKSLIINLKNENFKYNKEIKSMEETLVKQKNELKQWKEKKGWQNIHNVLVSTDEPETAVAHGFHN